VFCIDLKWRLLPYTSLKNWFCITHVESVYCAVCTESLHITNMFCLLSYCEIHTPLILLHDQSHYLATRQKVTEWDITELGLQSNSSPIWKMKINLATSLPCILPTFFHFTVHNSAYHMCQQQFVLTHTIHRNELPTLTDSWVTNTPSAKMLYP